jgi:hypothetical protein
MLHLLIKKIYSYNILKNKAGIIQNYTDVSNKLMTVESSLGIYGDYLILATGESGGKNKIYALNKNKQITIYHPIIRWINRT